MLLIFFESFVSILRGRFLILLQQTLTVLTIVTFRFWMAHCCRVDIGRSEINAHVSTSSTDFLLMRTPVKAPYTRSAEQEGRQKSAELLVREETGSPNDYYRSLLLFLNILYKETEIYFCNNQIDKAHFRLRMVLSLLTIKPAVNLPNAGKVGYGPEKQT